MNEIKCSVKGCPSIFKTAEAVSANARFICKDHNRATHVRAAGRKYNPNTDEADSEVRFQTHQFDKELKRHGSTPDGTEHIPNQGSAILNASSIAYGNIDEDQLIDWIDQTRV